MGKFTNLLRFPSIMAEDHLEGVLLLLMYPQYNGHVRTR